MPSGQPSNQFKAKSASYSSKPIYIITLKDDMLLLQERPYGPGARRCIKETGRMAAHNDVKTPICLLHLRGRSRMPNERIQAMAGRDA